MKYHLDPSTPVGVIARDHPELLELFDRLRIDYCCRGHETLETASRRAGTDPIGVAEAAERQSAPDPRDPATPSTMTQWCDHIEAVHHNPAREAFARFDDMLPRVLAAHAQAHPEFNELAEVVRVLHEEMLDHMVREERVLFPWLRRLEQPGAVHTGPPWSVQRPIDCMKHDHDSVSASIDRVRALTNRYTPPADACATVRALFELLRNFETDTRRHIHKENNILFPAGMEAEARSGRRIRRTSSEVCSHEPCSHHRRGAEAPR